jgi:hypothetical protein
VSFSIVTVVSLLQQGLGERHEARVRDEPYGVVDALFFTVIVEDRHREVRVGADLDLRLLAPCPPQPAHDALQDANRPAACVGVAVPQDDREQLAHLTVEDQKRVAHVLAVVAVVVAYCGSPSWPLSTST